MSKKAKFGSAREGIELLPRAIAAQIRKKLAPVLSEDFAGWSGEDLKAWRTSEPKVTQADLSLALGVSQSTLPQAERRESIGKYLSERFFQAYHVLVLEKADHFVDDESGLAPEEEFAEALGGVRKLLNKYRPLVGQSKLEPQFEEMFLSCDRQLSPLYSDAIKLSRAAETKRSFNERCDA